MIKIDSFGMLTPGDLDSEHSICISAGQMMRMPTDHVKELPKKISLDLMCVVLVLNSENEIEFSTCSLLIRRDQILFDTEEISS